MTELSKTAKKQLDNSYEFGSTTFWECLEGIRGKKLDAEAVVMEIIYQAVQFIETKGWAEDEILKYMKNAYKDATANQLYQHELSKIKADHRQAGELTDIERDTERAIMFRKKGILKEGDPIDVTKEIKTEELAAAKPAAEEPAVAEA